MASLLFPRSKRTGGFRVFTPLAALLIACSSVLLWTAPAYASTVPTGVNVSATEGTALVAVTVATFTASDAGPFTASIAWGDGTSSTGTVAANTSGGFSVTGSHTYVDDGSYTITTSITDAADSTTSNATSTASISEGLFAVSAGSPIGSPTTLNEGVLFNGTVATFTDSGATDAASSYTASIAWGDGTTTAGTVVANGSGAFSVTGSHTYVDELSGSYSVTVSEPAASFTAGPVSNTVTVSEGDAGAINAVTLTVPEGGTLSNVAVGSYTDTGNPSSTAADWTASIDWGDGTSSPGTITGSTGGPFTVTGSHTYGPSPDESTIPVTVTVHDDAPSTLNFQILSSVQVTEADTLSAGATQPTVAAAIGSPFSGPVAVFDDTYSGAPSSDFAATIDWGDGTTTAGTVSGSAGGPFTVSGSHTYTSRGDYTVKTTLTNDSPGTATASATSTVVFGTATAVSSSVNPLVAGQPVTYTATVSPVPDGGTVTFYDNGSAISTCTSLPVDTSTGKATCTVTYPTASSHAIHAIYSGVTHYASSISPTLTETNQGYGLVAADGGFFTFGVAFLGSMAGTQLNSPVVGMAFDPTTGGYYEVAADGSIFAFGAPYLGSMGDQHLSAPVVGMAFDSVTGGYYEVAADGSIFAFDAPYLGSMAGKHLNAPVVGMAFDPTTGGYYEVAADGGIFTFGAPFLGSMAGKHLNAPVVGMAYDSLTGGYYEVAADGGIFTFGAPFLGSMGSSHLNAPVVGMAYDSATGGYYEVAADGGVFTFGVPFLGSMGSSHLNAPVVGMEVDL